MNRPTTLSLSINDAAKPFGFKHLLKNQYPYPSTTVLMSMVVLMMNINIGSHFLVNVPCILQLSKGGIVNG